MSDSNKGWWNFLSYKINFMSAHNQVIYQIDNNLPVSYEYVKDAVSKNDEKLISYVAENSNKITFDNGKPYSECAEELGLPYQKDNTTPVEALVESVEKLAENGANVVENESQTSTYQPDEAESSGDSETLDVENISNDKAPRFSLYDTDMMY